MRAATARADGPGSSRLAWPGLQYPTNAASTARQAALVCCSRAAAHARAASAAAGGPRRSLLRTRSSSLVHATISWRQALQLQEVNAPVGLQGWAGRVQGSQRRLNHGCRTVAGARRAPGCLPQAALAAAELLQIVGELLGGVYKAARSCGGQLQGLMASQQQGGKRLHSLGQSMAAQGLAGGVEGSRAEEEAGPFEGQQCFWRITNVDGGLRLWECCTWPWLLDGRCWPPTCRAAQRSHDGRHAAQAHDRQVPA